MTNAELPRRIPQQGGEPAAFQTWNAFGAPQQEQYEQQEPVRVQRPAILMEGTVALPPRGAGITVDNWYGSTVADTDKDTADLTDTTRSDMVDEGETEPIPLTSDADLIEETKMLPADEIPRPAKQREPGRHRSGERRKRISKKARHRLGVALAGLAFLAGGAGIGTIGGVATKLHNGGEPTAEAPSQGDELAADQPDIISTTVLPKSMPAAVKKAMPSVVRISSTVHNKSIIGSGVYLGNGRIATIPETVATEKGTRLAPCRALEVSAGMKPGGRTATVGNVRISGTEASDMATISLTPSDIATLGAGVVKTTMRDTVKNPVKNGEAVVVAGWSFAKDGDPRTPDTSYLDPSKGQTRKNGHAQPHITGGIIVKQNAAKNQATSFGILQGIKTYSKLTDATKGSNPGDGGGAIFDMEGRLLGVVASSTEPIKTKATTGNVLEAYGLESTVVTPQPREFKPVVTMGTFVGKTALGKTAKADIINCLPVSHASFKPAKRS